MHLNLKEDKLILEKKLNKLHKLYDYIIIGSGPAASVILNNLIKTQKKILVVERGGFKKNFTENVFSENFKIKKDSRIFGVGGTSNTWAQIYSKISKNEMCNNKNINVWPLSHGALLNWCNKIGPKYKFDMNNLGNQAIYEKKFYSRKFIELKSPLRFSKFFNNQKFDMISNCKVETLDETKKINSIFFDFENKKYSINSKKIIICAGTLESCSLIINSIKLKKLKKIKNKKFIGRYFMDHPKCYIGEIEFPKKNLIDKFKLKSKKNINFYYGLSLFQKNKRTLNTYIRFEEIKSLFRYRKKIVIKIFLEMEPKFQNKIYIKNNKLKISLLLSKKEIEISKKLLAEIKKLFSLKPKSEKFNLNIKDLTDASHHIGGLSYPKIVNKNLKIQGLKNIFCCSSAVFPTSGSVNPTLIICGLAERLSKFLK
jgi:hypothetical protein